MKILIIILFFTFYSYAIEIKQMPINFTQNRIELTKQYVKILMEWNNNINIIPR